MPKKTKKEKIAASIHKQNSPINHSIRISYIENKSEVNKETVVSLIPSAHAQKKTSSPELEIEKNSLNFKIDLKRSLTIIFVILALELGLYYASIRGLF